MKVPQLMYGSSGSGRLRGYQLLGRSAGLSEQLVQRFCRWAPSHGALQRQSADACSWSWFQIADDRWAIARTVYGGPEYSGRGGLQVVTIALLLNRAQLAGYQHHPLDVANSALSLGHLILPLVIRSSLPEVSLPRAPFTHSATAGHLPDHVVQLVQSGQQTCVSYDGDPLDVLNQLYAQLPMQNRLAVSFTTALKPSAHRDVQIQFLNRDDQATIRQQQRQNKTCIELQCVDLQRCRTDSSSLSHSSI